MSFGVVIVMVGSNMLNLPVDSCSQPMSCHFDERYHCCIARNIANSAWAYATTQLPSIWARKDTELLLDVRVLQLFAWKVVCYIDGFEASHFLNEVQGVHSPTFA